MRFEYENFTAERFSLDNVRIKETRLYNNLLCSIVIFIRYVLQNTH